MRMTRTALLALLAVERGLAQGKTRLAAQSGGFVAALLRLGLRDHRWDGARRTFGRERDEGEIGRIGVADDAGLEILHHNLDADLHGRAEDAIDAGAESDELA